MLNRDKISLDILGKSLYFLNKEAKELRDRKNLLKEDLFYNGGIETRYNEMRSEEALESIKESLRILDLEESNANDALAKGEKYFSDELYETIESEEDMKLFIDEVKELEDTLESIEEIVEKAYSDVSVGGDLAKEQDRLYEIKNILVERYGTLEDVHRFEHDDDNVYDLYRIGENTFHIIREPRIDEETDDYLVLEDLISSEVSMVKDADTYSIDDLEELTKIAD